MKKKISVLVVERDPMLLLLESDFVERIGSFRVCGRATSLHELEQFFRFSSKTPELVLLEPFLPYNSLSKAMRLLRSTERRAEVIVVSLCSESSVVAEAFSMGIFDYIVKPFEIERFRRSMLGFERYFSGLSALPDDMSQERFDRLFRRRAMTEEPLFRDPPKNLNRETAMRVLDVLYRTSKPLSAVEVADDSKLSRSTARRYLIYLAEEGLIGCEEEQGVTGRPRIRYFPLLRSRLSDS